MKQKVTALALGLKEKAIYFILAPFLAFIGLAFLFQVFFVVLQFSGNENLATQIANEITWRIDGTFKNNPDNIWYEADEHIWVESVTNNVKIGKLAGNRNLEFGVKNVLEEYLQDKGYNLSSSAPNKVSVQIIFLDVLTTKKNISVFHSGEEAVVIRLRGVLKSEGKKDKVVIVEESSSEITMSTLIIGEGGGFSQTSLSHALKKSCDKLITKLFEDK